RRQTTPTSSSGRRSTSGWRGRSGSPSSRPVSAALGAATLSRSATGTHSLRLPSSQAEPLPVPTTLSRMRGAVAAGHPLTAQAGARVLAEGGNAVDACVAAAFAGAVAESPLTSPGAGGFMLVHRAADRSTRLADFFVAAPGLGLGHPAEGAMEEVDLGFGDGETTQVFRIGAA